MKKWILAGAVGVSGVLVACGGADEGGAPDASGAAGASSPRPLDVLLITLDTTRADRLGCYGNESVETPNLDALARESTVFDRAYTAIPSTLSSHATVFTGLYPEQHGIHDNGCYRLPPEQITLAERLAENGWNTGGFAAAFVLDRQFGIEQGFEIYDDQMLDPLNEHSDPRQIPPNLPPGLRRWFVQCATSYQRRAEAVTGRVEEWLDTELDERPFFLWVHYFDPHEPYDAPGEFETRYDPNYRGPLDGSVSAFGDEMRRRQREMGEAYTPAALEREHRHMVARYEGEISYTDHWIGRLRAMLEQRGRWRDTLVVVVADHGEAFGEHGQIWEHKAEVYEEVARVPLLIRPPGGEVGRARWSGVARTVDLMPSVLDWVGVEGPRMQGRSLRGVVEGTENPSPISALLETGRHQQIAPVPVQYLAACDDTGKTLLHIDHQGQVRRVQRFDHREDPDESRGRVLEAEEARAASQQVLGQFRALPGRATELPLRPLGDLVSDALKDLGYLDEDDGPGAGESGAEDEDGARDEDGRRDEDGAEHEGEEGEDGGA